MTTELIFPKAFKTTKYQWVHYYFFIEYAKAANVDIKFIDETPEVYIGGLKSAHFSCLINSKHVIVDFADHKKKTVVNSNDAQYFKFQTNTPVDDHVIPLGPPITGIPFDAARAGADAYFELQKHFEFEPGTLICNKQSAYRNAFVRRQHVQSLLAEQFGDRYRFEG